MVGCARAGGGPWWIVLAGFKSVAAALSKQCWPTHYLCSWLLSPGDHQLACNPTSLLTTTGLPSLWPAVLFAFVKTGDADAVHRMLSSEVAKANANIQDAASGET